MWSCTCHLLHVFPPLPPVEARPNGKKKSWQRFATRYMFSRDCYPSPVFPRLPSVTCFPAIATRYMFSPDCHPFLARLPKRFTSTSDWSIAPFVAIVICAAITLVYLYNIHRSASFQYHYQSYLKQSDPVHRQFDKNKTAVRQEHFLDILWNLSNKLNW